MVPKGWEEVQFSSIVKETQLGTTERHKGEVCEEAIPLLKMGNLTWGSFNLTNLELIPRAKVDKNLILKKGDFLFNTRNTPELVGKSAVWDGRIKEITFDNNINRITFTEKVDSFYLRYYLNFGKGKSKINSLPAGSTSVAAIYWKDLKNIKVIIPPLPEQQKIAKILSTWDKAISTTERLIDNSTQQKKALMQQLLTGKKRLLDDEGKRFDKKWERIELGKLLDYKQPTPYLVKSTDYSDEYPTPVLTAGKTFILGYTDEEFGIFSEDLPTIIFDDFTTASKFVDFPFKAKSSAMKMLVAKDGVSIKYIFEVMQALSYAIGGHQRHWISIFANIVIGLPCLEEQQKITAVSNNADKEIELLEQQLADLQQEKKALMQVLLTGKKRVVV
ncbi:restriction endonuclease subunit S [Psychrobacter sp. HY3-MNA-CIBAN-0198]|uniref:restriction endonuclease subunit S n=1 Tax=Psychrobacter sp. HY3-MNA-CIBAN-0198 TaxID=3140441 RepID=UPI00332C70E7